MICGICGKNHYPTNEELGIITPLPEPAATSEEIVRVQQVARPLCSTLLCGKPAQEECDDGITITRKCKTCWTRNGWDKWWEQHGKRPSDQASRQEPRQ